MSGGKTARGGKDAKARVRQCALTRVCRDPQDLIRFVLDADGHVVPDLKRRLPGRGVWLTAARDVIAEAAKAGVFPRAFRRPVIVGDDLPERVEQLLARAALGRLSLSNKAGQVVSGFHKVDQALGRDPVAALIHASDAAADGCAKLDAKHAKVSASQEGQPKVVACFNNEELSLALGRSNVVHAAVIKGGATTSFLDAAAKLERFRAGGAAFAAA